ncbi:hypothetical protein BASA50_006086 [Batrachochytrium salamandrivorans]|uniref:Uncharacterized protein n=1 Tax=Batrachochytrium salamandrivorans TaxID=1357716 RepID=A0ABQ8FAV0_9FUNG|nr:hypothetical protein BASA50_006086 [Batrachochytrium salamandrivorans]
MFSRIKAWGKSVLKIFKPCDSVPANSATHATDKEHMSTTTVATMDCMTTPIVAKSQIIQASQPSAYLPNDPDRIYSESDIRVESVPMATIHKTRSDIPKAANPVALATEKAANPIALATEKSASDMVISGCQTQQDSIKAKSAKIKEKMDSGVDIAKELYPIKDFAYDDSDQFIFKSYIAIDGIHDVPTKCIVVYDKSNRLKIHEIADGTVSPPHWVNIHPIKSMERYYCKDRPTWTEKCRYKYIMCVISENNTCPDNIQRMFICTSSERRTFGFLDFFMSILSKKEAKKFYTIDH